MNFLYWKWFPLILLGASCFVFYIIKYELSYFKWIKKYWFFEENRVSKIRRIFYLSGFIFLSLALLDLRGPREKIELEVPEQKTIIVIDASASMLVEDVRPNRFKKSLLIARHFIKKAAGHRISLVLFSDTQKNLVPFTDDIDLLDSRVAGLESTDINSGGSNIAQALMEALQYFKTNGGTSEIKGNILLFTDGEENEEILKLNIPEGISLGVVGIGTLKGGVIPIRDQRGILRGYKNYNDERVVSKLNEKFLKDMANLAIHYKYWIASSYTLPTEEVLAFFRASYEEILSKGTVHIFPVKLEYVALPGIILLILANILSMHRTFKTLSLVFFSFIFATALTSPSILANEEKEKKPSTLNYDLWKRHKLGELNTLESVKLAENLLENEEYELALNLYEENINIETASPESMMNYAISLAKMKQTLKALKIFEKLSGKIKQEEYSYLSREDLQQNILFALQNQSNQENKQSKDEKQKNNENDEGKNQEKKQNQQEKGEQEEDKQDQNESEDKGQEKNQDENQDEKKDNEQNAQKEENSRDGDSQEEKSETAKIPAILKQILDDDRELQKKFIDTSTKNPQKNQHKDW